MVYVHFSLLRIDDDGNSKHETEEDVDDDGTATKDSDSKATDSKDAEFDRPSSSGKKLKLFHRWEMRNYVNNNSHTRRH